MLTMQRAAEIIKRHTELTEAAKVLDGDALEHVKDEIAELRAVFAVEARTAVEEAARTPEEQATYEQLVVALRGLFEAVLTRPFDHDKPINPDGDFGRDDGKWHLYQTCRPGIRYYGTTHEITAVEIGPQTELGLDRSMPCSFKLLRSALYQALKNLDLRPVYLGDQTEFTLPVYGVSGGYGGKTIVYVIRDKEIVVRA